MATRGQRRRAPTRPPRGNARAPSAVRAKAPAAVVAPVPDGERGWVERALEEVLTPTCWIDSGVEPGPPFAVTIAFSGRHRDGDRFLHHQTVTGIVPGSGPVAITTQVRGVAAGDWEVTATPVRARGEQRRIRMWPPAAVAERRVIWPRRRKLISAAQPALLRTALLPFAPVPGIRRAVWAPLVALGVIAGVVMQVLLLARAHVDIATVLAICVASVLAGGVGAKLWFIALHRGRRAEGWCIQGAIAGGALTAVLAAALLLAHVPVGGFLNAAAPALMLGIAIGRPGCFWAGCCVGRPTTSRYGIWSSDRHLGIRRIPTQLLEALLGLIIAAAALVIVLTAGLGDSGALLLGTLAAYTLGRQLILPHRAEPRQTTIGRPATITLAALALPAAIALQALL